MTAIRSEVPAGRAAAEGDIVEVNEPARAFIAPVANPLRQHAGAALLLDCGPARSATGDSLQALTESVRSIRCRSLVPPI